MATADYENRVTSLSRRMLTRYPLIPKIPLPLCREFAEGRVVLFIGAGVSIAAHAPGWEGLVTSLFRQHGDDVENLDLSLEQKVSLFLIRHGRLELNQNLDEQLNQHRDLTFHENIVSLPISLIMTTNYDPHLQQAAEKVGRACNLICKDHEVPRKFSRKDLTIIHLYGTTDEALASEEDLITFERERPALSLLLQQILLTRTVLFLGFSFRDFNVLNHVLRVQSLVNARQPKEHVIKHYAYMLEPKPPELIEIWCERRLCILATKGFPEDQKLDKMSDVLGRFIRHLSKDVREFSIDKIQREEMIFREENNFLQASKQSLREPVMRRESTFSVLALPDKFEDSGLQSKKGYEIGIKRKKLYLDWLNSGSIRLVLNCHLDILRARRYTKSVALQRIAEIKEIVAKHRAGGRLIIGVSRYATGDEGFSSLGDSVLFRSIPEASDKSSQTQLRGYKKSNVIRDREAIDIFAHFFDQKLSGSMRDAGTTDGDLKKKENIETLTDATLRCLETLKDSVEEALPEKYDPVESPSIGPTPSTGPG